MAGANGAWLRSQSSFTTQTVEGRVTFGGGAWQHVGFADDGFASRYAILSTVLSGTTLLARTAVNGAETSTPISTAALGTVHDVRIVWQASKVDYYVDGALAASHPVAITAPMYVYASNNGSAPLTVDWLRAGSYATGSVTYTSCIKDSSGAALGAALLDPDCAHRDDRAGRDTHLRPTARPGRAGPPQQTAERQPAQPAATFSIG